MFSATDWALKRVLKFILKKNVGKYLRSEVDLEQLDVRTGTGRLEMRNVLFNCDAVNQHLALQGFKLTAGYVGSVSATIPITALQNTRCTVEVKEVLLTVTPLDKAALPSQSPQQPAQSPDDATSVDNLFDDMGWGQLGVSEGIKRVAGSIEVILRQMCVTAEDITLRLEIPASPACPQGSAITFHLDRAAYSDETPLMPPPANPTTTAPPPIQELIKSVTISDFSIDLLPSLSPPDPLPIPTDPLTTSATSLSDLDSTIFSGQGGSSGCSATLLLKLNWQPPPPNSPSLTPPPPVISADITLTPIRLRFLPHHLSQLQATAQQLQSALPTASTQQPPPAQDPMPHHTSAMDYSSAGAGHHQDEDSWGRRSFVEGLFMPHCEDFIAESLGYQGAGPASSRYSAASDPAFLGASAYDEFHDARSSVGSLAGSAAYGSALSGGASSAYGSAMGGGGPAAYGGASSNGSTAYGSTMGGGGSSAYGSGAGAPVQGLYYSGHDYGAGPPHTSSWEQVSLGGGLSAGADVHAGRAGTAAAGRGQQAGHSPAWSVNVAVADVSLVLCYAVEGRVGGEAGVQQGVVGWEGLEDAAEEDGGDSVQYSRFVIECSDVSLSAELSHSSCHANLQLYQLEAMEYLPHTTRRVSRTTPQEYMHVPRSLPQGLPVARPLPAHLGQANNPYPTYPRHPSAPVYPPATALQLWPVLCFGGSRKSDGGRPSLSVKLSKTSKPSSASACGKICADVEAMPLTAWLCFDTLQRLASFLGPLLTPPAPPTAPSGGLPNPHSRPPRTEVQSVFDHLDSIMDDLQECARPDSGYHHDYTSYPSYTPGYPSGHHNGYRSSAPPASSLPSLELSLTIPQICIVTQLPDPPTRGPAAPLLSGYKFLACDLFSVAQGSEGGRAGGRRGWGQQQYVPAVVARQGVSAEGLVTKLQGSVECVVAQAQLYLVGYAPGYSDLRGNSTSQATCILDIRPSSRPTTPSPSPAFSSSPSIADPTLGIPPPRPPKEQVGPDNVPPGCGLFTEVTWDPSAEACLEGLHEAWRMVALHAQDRWAEAEGSSWEDHSNFTAVKLQENCRQSSQVFCHIRAPHIAAELSRSDLLALWHLISSTLLTSPPPSTPAPTPTQISTVVHCRLHCSLQTPPPSTTGPPSHAAYPPPPHPSLLPQPPPTFSLKAEDITLFHVTTLGGVLGASAATLHMGGITLSSTPSHAVHLFCPLPTTSTSHPSIDLLHVIRPDPRSPSSPLPPPSRAAGSLRIRDATLATDHGAMSFDWAARLGQFFTLDLGTGWAPDGQRVDADPSGGVSFTVNVENVALRYEPPPEAGRAAVAAALLVEGAHWGLEEAGAGAQADAGRQKQQEVVLHSLGVHLAAASRRGTGWEASCGRDLKSTNLQAAGYHCIAQEGTVRVVVQQPTPALPTFEVDVTNQSLLGSFTMESMILLLQLAQQLAPPPPVHDDTFSRHSAIPLPSSPSASSGCSAMSTVRVLEGVQEDAFRGTSSSMSGGSDGPSGGKSMAASVFMAGGWYAEEEEGEAEEGSDGLSEVPLPSSPFMIEDFFLEAPTDPSAPSARASTSPPLDPMDCERGTWFSPDGTYPVADIREDYLRTPSLSSPSHVLSPLAVRIEAPQQAAEDPLPLPISKICLRNLNGLLVLHSRGPPGTPSEARIEVELEGLTLSLEEFPGGGQMARRSTLTLHSLEARDCSVRRETGSRWAHILSYCHRSGSKPRDARAPMLHALLEAVRPDPDADPTTVEFRLSVAALPLRVRLDQDVLEYLTAFGQGVSAALPRSAPGVVAAAAKDDGGGADGMYFQKVELKGSAVVVDYRPRRVDLAALRDGSFVELVNLVPWGGVEIVLKGVRLAGVEGWDGMLAASAAEWLQDIAANQKHKFVTGMAPISSICRVGSAVSGLLAVPASQLRSQTSGGRPGDSRLARQLRRSTTSFVRALVFEALGLGATMATGAQMVLQGASGQQAQPNEQPSTLYEGLRQAADRLSSGLEVAANELLVKPTRSLQQGEGMRSAVLSALRGAPAAAVAPATAAVAAVRCTLLGARNSLDPDRKLT